ncbi:hypothetical protein [Tunturiibacter gelidiferens]|uniref:bestrophin-like domain n=1 Tax=Tunturiibacter gelidiferens TaxID=3069689 RepID=UPI003D9BD136
MNSIPLSGVVFACVVVAALVGMAIRRILPEDHLCTDVKETVRLSTALISTMAALVLGMLVSSAKSTYDASQNEVVEMSSEIVSIDRSLERYGPETENIRPEFRRVVAEGIQRIWPAQSSLSSERRPADKAETLVDQLEHLQPKDSSQVAAKSQITLQIIALRHTQWLMFLKSQHSSVPTPLLVVLISWLAIIFVGFGLFAPSNATIFATNTHRVSVTRADLPNRCNGGRFRDTKCLLIQSYP